MESTITPEQADEERERARAESVEQGLREAGQPTEEKVPADYFGFDVTHTVTLPDGVSKVYHKSLNEGQRRQFLNSVNKDIRLQRATGDAVIRAQMGEERYQLLKTAITGWKLFRGGDPVAFEPKALDEFLGKADPKIIDLIEKDVRKQNAWLMDEISADDLEREIETMKELLEKKREEEQGN